MKDAQGFEDAGFSLSPPRGTCGAADWSGGGFSLSHPRARKKAQGWGTVVHSLVLGGFAGVACWTMAGCHAPGKPGPEPEVVRPEEVKDFAVLYKQNCAACHGESGQHGLAPSLGNPVFIALAGRNVLISTVSKGVPGHLMPAFGKSNGGTLTDEQIAILADGIQSHWGNAQALGGMTPPSYAATLTGNVDEGQMNFHFYCARCHEMPIKPAAAGLKHASVDAGPVTDPSYLALISDQGLRSTILSGRPEDGMPDWRSFAAQPLTDQQVTDIVAWLGSQRKSAPGQPYPEHPQVP